MSVSVVVELKCKPESTQEMIATLKIILPETRVYEGCESIIATIRQDDPNRIVLIESWDSRESHEKYMAYRTETGTMEALGALLAVEPAVSYSDRFDA